MAGDEDELEKIVAHVIIERAVEIGRSHLSDLKFAAQFLMLAIEQGIAAEEIDGAAFGGGGEPCAGFFGDSGSRPLFQGGEKGFLREVFGEADVACEAGEAGDDAGGLDAPDSFDGAV